MPQRVILTRPALGHGAARHRADGALDPDRRVDMHRDAQDQPDRAGRVQHDGQAAQQDREAVGKPRLPEGDAGDEQHRKAAGHQPEHALLAGVVLADRGHGGLVAAQHVGTVLHPFAVGRREHVFAPQAQEQDREGRHHDDAKERMQDARPDPAPEQRTEEVQARVEEGQAGQPGQHEHQRDEPVVHPVAVFIATQVSDCHVVLLQASVGSVALSSASSFASTGPTFM
mmetsp:Transcript_48410/g.117859  ORF Transcript_48410/g.117859 Transcript_48410/m.117859 type:complete len:228 (-) Transcript_48410:354-1037(-)